LADSPDLEEPTREEIQEIDEDGVLRSSATQQDAEEEGQSPVALGATGPR